MTRPCLAATLVLLALWSAPALGAPCADVTFLGARASGEPADAHGGLGPAVEHVSALVAGGMEAAGLTFRALAVDYPARPTRDLYLPWHGNVARYFRSIATGIRSAVTLAEAVERRCPATRLLLGGYSQGAMVVHQAVRRLSARVRDRVAAAVLIGDGDRVSGTRAVRFGSAPARAQGIRATLLPWTRRNVVVPDRTADVCNAGDLVCDFAARRLLGPRALHRAIAAHRAYADPRPGGTFSFSPLLARAAAWAVGLLVRGAVPARGPTAVLAGVGADFGGWRAATQEPLHAGPSLPRHLHRDRCLVLLLPDPLDASIDEAIERYLRAGGTVIGLGERGDGGRFSAADAALGALTGQLDLDLAPAGDARDPGTTVSAWMADDLMSSGVARLGYDWATALNVGPRAHVLAWTADGAAPLLAEQRLGAGRFVLAGDSDLFTGGRGDAFGRGDNAALVRRLCP